MPRKNKSKKQKQSSGGIISADISDLNEVVAVDNSVNEEGRGEDAEVIAEPIPVLSDNENELLLYKSSDVAASTDAIESIPHAGVMESRKETLPPFESGPSEGAPTEEVQNKGDVVDHNAGNIRPSEEIRSKATSVADIDEHFEESDDEHEEDDPLDHNESVDDVGLEDGDDYDSHSAVVDRNKEESNQGADGWVLYTSEEGYKYYYNHITGESQWADHSMDQQSDSLLTKTYNNYSNYDYGDSSYGYDESTGYNPERNRDTNAHMATTSRYQATGPGYAAHNAPSVPFYRVAPLSGPGRDIYGPNDRTFAAVEINQRVGYEDYAYSEHDANGNEDSYVDEEESHPYSNDEEDDIEGGYGSGGSSEQDQDDGGFETQFSEYLKSDAGQKALLDEQKRIERKAARLARKKLRTDIQRSWLASRGGKERVSDEDLGGQDESGVTRDYGRGLSSRHFRGVMLSVIPGKKSRNWEVDAAELGEGEEPLSRRGSGGSSTRSSATSTDDDEISSTDSDVQEIMAPTIPEITSASALIETLRPFQLFLFRFVEVGAEVTKELAETAWTQSSTVIQQASSTASAYAVDAMYRALDIIRSRGLATYAVINEAVIQIVEADIEGQSPSVNRDISSKLEDDSTRSSFGVEDVTVGYMSPEVPAYSDHLFQQALHEGVDVGSNVA